MVYHHPAKVGGHSYCGSRDIMFLVCHMISQDDRLKGHVTIDRSPSK